MAMSRMALELADSSAHGFGDVGIYGSKQVYIVCCGGSLLLGRRGHERSAILQQLVCQWQFVQEQLGLHSFLSRSDVCHSRRDSVAQEGYDELGALRDHFQIAEGQRTINSYCCEIDGWELYGKRRGKKLHFQGSRPRARQIMERIAQDTMLETEMEEGKLSVVVCAGWNTLSQTVICYQELQCLKALSKCATVAEFLQVSVAFSGLPLLSFSELWLHGKTTQALQWLPRRRMEYLCR